MRLLLSWDLLFCMVDMVRLSLLVTYIIWAKMTRDVAVCLIKTVLCLWQALGCSKPLGADVISFSYGSFFINV